MNPKYEIGQTFFIPTTKSEPRKHDCPDCLGERKFTVQSPAGGNFTMECPRCIGSYQIRDVPSLSYNHYEPDVNERVITGYSVNDWGEDGITYKSREGNAVKEASLIVDRDKAMQAATIMAAEQNKRAAETIERIHKDKLSGLPLVEATSSMFRNGLYDSWGAFRHLRETVDEILDENSADYLSLTDVRDGLSNALDGTMRYEFVFKGFTRIMEGLVRLMADDGTEQEDILARMRKEWSDAPDELKKVWEPNEKLRCRWDGTMLPKY